MSNIRIKFKDGTQRIFLTESPHTSFGKTVRYEKNFLVITDEYRHEIAFPTKDIKQVDVRSNTYRFSNYWAAGMTQEEIKANRSE